MRQPEARRRGCGEDDDACCEDWSGKVLTVMSW